MKVTREETIRTKLLRVAEERFIIDHVTDRVSRSNAEIIARFCRLLHNTDIPDDWNWNWEVNSGSKFRGKMPRRLRNLCRVKKLALPIEKLLQKTREDMPTPWIYVLDVTFNIDWQDGDFGDPDSCYWNHDGAKLDVMNRCGFGAVRRYALPSRINSNNIKEDGVLDDVKRNLYSLGGYGRAWMAPDHPKVGMITMYNTYPSGFYTTEFASLFCKILPKMINEQRDFVHCGGHIDYSANSDIYVNSGSCEIVGEPHQIAEWDGKESCRSVSIKLESVDV